MQPELIARNWRELIRPRRLESDEAEATDRYARFWCEPLERGFGQTLGNSLRRVLLSSLQGAAITTLRVQGVLHEFSTIPGVLEDVSDIVLNLKEVRLRMHAQGPRVLRVRKSGDGILTAGDLVSDDSSIEVMNPEHKIATLSADAEVDVELTVDVGKGYRHGRREQERGNADRNHPDRLDLLPRAAGQLLGVAGSRRARDGLRPPEPRGLDRRRGGARRTPWPTRRRS